MATARAPQTLSSGTHKIPANRESTCAPSRKQCDLHTFGAMDCCTTGNMDENRTDENKLSSLCDVANCKVGPQTFRSYKALLKELPERSIDDNDNEERESSLDTEPNQYFIAYRASGDGYTRYMTKAALSLMPPVYFNASESEEE